MHPRRASQQQPAGRKGIWNLQKARAALLRTPKPPSLGPPGSSDPFINIHSIFQAGKPETFAAQTTGNLFFFFLRFLNFPSNSTPLCPFSGPLLPSRAHLEKELEALKRLTLPLA